MLMMSTLTLSGSKQEQQYQGPISDLERAYDKIRDSAIVQFDRLGAVCS